MEDTHGLTPNSKQAPHFDAIFEHKDAFARLPSRMQLGVSTDSRLHLLCRLGMTSAHTTQLNKTTLALKQCRNKHKSLDLEAQATQYAT